MAGLPTNIDFMRDELGALYYLTPRGERINVALYKQGEFPVIGQADSVTGEIEFSAGDSSLTPGERAYAETCKDVVNGSGPLNGQLLDSGQVWELGGAGYLTTIINGDHIEGTQNTYCHVNTGRKIAKAVQYYSGAMATIQVGLNSAISDMIHANFSSGGASHITYWKTGVGTGQGAQWSVDVANCPNMNDGVPHKCELHITGNIALAYCDGSLTSIAYDTNFPSITGDWFFAQIHGAGEKIYGVEAYSGTSNSDTSSPASILEAVFAKAASFHSLTVGNPLGIGFNPSSSSFFWTADSDGHVFASDQVTTVRSKATQNGYSARILAQASIGTETAVVSGNDGVGSIQHQGSDRIRFPFNVSRTDMQTPVTLPVFTVAGLPSATVPYQRAFVSDALAPAFGATVAGGGAVKVPVYSDGTNWKVG